MSNGWEGFDSAPIEKFHGEAGNEFHKGAEFAVNEVKINNMRFVNGIEFNRLLAKFKVKIMKAYGITTDAIPSVPLPNHNIRFTYTNYKKETAQRLVTPIGMRYGKTDWHPDYQWLLRAYCHDRKAERDFALKDIRDWRELS